MKILLVNQCFYPDVVSAGQHLTDLARELADRGHRVTVISSRRGYDDPSLVFPSRECWSGIDIHRVPILGLGKQSKVRRVMDFLSFYFFCFMRMLSLPNQDLIVMLTSPPLIAFAGALLSRLTGARLVVWIMDLNPDEAIAAGVLNQNSIVATFLKGILRTSLQQASRIIVLDRFMKEKVLQRGIPAEKIMIVPPWSHDKAVSYDQQGRMRFRGTHGLDGKFVVMYSGNHSPCHPLDTLLAAARHLNGDCSICFCFIGGGSEFSKVQQFATEWQLSNILCLPYQPLDKLSASLSAADLHVIVMGDPYTGIKHPCKVYNVISLGIPFVFVGPCPSHVSDLVAEYKLQNRSILIRHGEFDLLAERIRQAAANARPTADVLSSDFARNFAQPILVPQLADILVKAGSEQGCVDVCSAQAASGR